MQRQLSSELGRQGVRVVTLRTGGVPETIPAGLEGMDAVVKDMADMTMLGRPATIDITAGALVD